MFSGEQLLMPEQLYFIYIFVLSFHFILSDAPKCIPLSMFPLHNLPLLPLSFSLSLFLLFSMLVILIVRRSLLYLAQPQELPEGHTM